MQLFSFRHFFKFTISIIFLLTISQASFAEEKKAPNVVVTIKPLHSLVAKVMDGVGSPYLLITGGTSPHDFQLKPSDAKVLNDANLVVRIGPLLETNLNKPLNSIAKKSSVFDTVDISELELLRFREKHDHGHGHGHGHKKKHDHGHKHGHKKKHDHAEKSKHKHDVAEIDPHVWLSIKNAKVITKHIGEKLSKIDPDNRAKYSKNVALALNELNELEGYFQENMKPVKHRAYMVFHDAYQYLMKGADVHYAGSISVPSAAYQPSAKHLRTLKRRLKKENVACVFTEPQFSPKIAETIVEGSKAKIAVLDPIGVDIPAGKDAYSQLYKQLVGSLSSCLAK